MEVSPELILGIIGSITGLLGATSFFIHVLKYLKEKPKIEARAHRISKKKHLNGSL